MKQGFIALCVAAALAALVAGCGAVPLKQKAVLTVQTAETALGAAQDTERSLYLQGTLPALTPERHKDISQAFSKAFQAQIDVTTALKAWRSEDPVPTSVTEILGYAQETWDVVAAIVPQLDAKTPSEKAFVERIRVWVKEVIDLAKLFNLPIPPILAKA